MLESDTPGRTPFAAPQSHIDQQAKQFKKDNAIAKLILLTGLDEFDQEDVEEMPKCQAIWKYLKTKYTDTRATTVLSLLRDLTTYTMKEVSKRNRQRAYVADSDLSNSQEHATYTVAKPRSDVNSKDIDYCFSSMENKWIPIRKGGLQRLDIDPHETNDNKWFRTSPPC